MKATHSPKNIGASFRDPSGFIFKENGVIYRQVNESYKDDYNILMSSGLFERLIKDGFMVNHKEVKTDKLVKPAYKVIKPDQIPFISYPYEWCFSQLKDAALLTLRIQLLAMEYGMSLKDATAYNIQFIGGKPVFIDTLSFEKYEEGKPWVAYRQFCQHFLAPLALIAHVDLRFGTLSRDYLDGIPLDLAAKLLPGKTKFSLKLGTHIHMHARSQEKHSGTVSEKQERSYNLSKRRLVAILSSLESAVNSLHLPKQKTVWGEYYDDTNYTSKSFKHKEDTISRWITSVKPKSVWDSSGNDGHFSRLASEKKIATVSADIDPVAIEKSFLTSKAEDDKYLLPILLDFTNPSPGTGWANDERESFFERGHFDLSLCLAFIHHLAIANNLPLSNIAEVYAKQSKYLIIEFVPKKDSNTMRLLSDREDIFPGYTTADFEKDFSKYFQIKDKVSVLKSHRTLYLMKRK